MKKSETVRILFHYLNHKYFRTFKTLKSLHKFHEQHLSKHLDFVWSHSPFYQKNVHAKDKLNIDAYPIVEKQNMMQQFDEWNTLRLQKDECLRVAKQAETSRDFSPTINDVTIGLSSGSSGQYGIFLVSENERVQWAGGMLAKALPRPIVQKERIAFFLRANSNLYETVEQTRLEFHYFDLMTHPDVLCEQLGKCNPTIIIAPPSMLRYMCEWALKQGVTFPELVTVYSVAEILEKEVKEELESFFQLPVYQIYQATEGFLGITCTHGTLHLNEDVLYIEKEYIDKEKTRFYPIITDLYRTSQPFVRFRLNDILVEKKEQCACGSVFTAIERIEGRSDDIFYFHKTSGEVELVFPDFIRKWFIHVQQGMNDYKVVQEDEENVVIYLDCEETMRESIIQNVTDTIGNWVTESNIRPFDVRWETKYVEVRGRKVRRIESKVNKQ